MATLSISTIQTLCRSLVGLVGVILLFSSQAKAECICDNSADLETLIEDADLIFRGELRSLSEDWEGCTRTGGWNYAMEAYEVFKGKAEARINIRSQAPGNDYEVLVDHLVQLESISVWSANVDHVIVFLLEEGFSQLASSSNTQLKDSGTTGSG